MAFHCELTGLDIHVINTWTYANSAAREAATGFVSDDVYKVAVQTDDDSIWMLVDHSPITWQQLGGVVVGDISHCDLDNLLVDCHTQYMPTDASRAFSQPVCGAPPTIGAHLATKAYVDGEVVTDHGALNGLLDVEDHPDYSTIDGSRAYTAPVSGQDPTLDNHLTTKTYVDTKSAEASAGIVEMAYITLGRLTSQTLSASDVYEDVIFKDSGQYFAEPKNITTLPSSAGVEVNIAGIYRFGFTTTWHYGNLPSTTIQYWTRANVNGVPVDNSEIVGWTRFSNTTITTTFPPILARLEAGDVITLQAKVDDNLATITFATLVLERVDD